MKLPPSTHADGALRYQMNAGSDKWSDAYIAWRCTRVQQLSDMRTRHEVLERIAEEELTKPWLRSSTP